MHKKELFQRLFNSSKAQDSDCSDDGASTIRKAHAPFDAPVSQKNDMIDDETTVSELNRAPSDAVGCSIPTDTQAGITEENVWARLHEDEALRHWNIIDGDIHFGSAEAAVIKRALLEVVTSSNNEHSNSGKGALCNNPPLSVSQNDHLESRSASKPGSTVPCSSVADQTCSPVPWKLPASVFDVAASAIVTEEVSSSSTRLSDLQGLSSGDSTFTEQPHPRTDIPTNCAQNSLSAHGKSLEDFSAGTLCQRPDKMTKKIPNVHGVGFAVVDLEHSQSVHVNSVGLLRSDKSDEKARARNMGPRDFQSTTEWSLNASGTGELSDTRSDSHSCHSDLLLEMPSDSVRLMPDGHKPGEKRRHGRRRSSTQSSLIPAIIEGRLLGNSPEGADTVSFSRSSLTGQAICGPSENIELPLPPVAISKHDAAHPRLSSYATELSKDGASVSGPAAVSIPRLYHRGERRRETVDNATENMASPESKVVEQQASSGASSVVQMEAYSKQSVSRDYLNEKPEGRLSSYSTDITLCEKDWPATSNNGQPLSHGILTNVDGLRKRKKIPEKVVRFREFPSLSSFDFSATTMSISSSVSAIAEPSHANLNHYVSGHSGTSMEDKNTTRTKNLDARIEVKTKSLNSGVSKFYHTSQEAPSVESSAHRKVDAGRNRGFQNNKAGSNSNVMSRPPLADVHESHHTSLSICPPSSSADGDQRSCQEHKEDYESSQIRDDETQVIDAEKDIESRIIEVGDESSTDASECSMGQSASDQTGTETDFDETSEEEKDHSDEDRREIGSYSQGRDGDYFDHLSDSASIPSVVVPPSVLSALMSDDQRSIASESRVSQISIPFSHFEGFDSSIFTEE